MSYRVKDTDSPPRYSTEVQKLQPSGHQWYTLADTQFASTAKSDRDRRSANLKRDYAGLLVDSCLNCDQAFTEKVRKCPRCGEKVQ